VKPLHYLNKTVLHSEIIEYLKDVPSVDDIKQLLTMLNFESARQLIRTKETIYKDLTLSTENDESTLIDAMVAHPKLIERPVVVNGDKAAVGRPPENVLAII